MQSMGGVSYFALVCVCVCLSVCVHACVSVNKIYKKISNRSTSFSVEAFPMAQGKID